MSKGGSGRNPGMPKSLWEKVKQWFGTKSKQSNGDFIDGKAKGGIGTRAGKGKGSR